MIHFKDQSEQLLEGAPTRSINIPPPEKSSCTKLKMQPKSHIQRINRLEIYGSERTVLGLQIQVRKEMDTALISAHLTLEEDSKQFENRWVCQNFVV